MFILNVMNIMKHMKANNNGDYKDYENIYKLVIIKFYNNILFISIKLN